jgi:hypothetical protein
MGVNKIGFPGISQPLSFGLEVGVQNPGILAQQISGVNKWGIFPVSLQGPSAFIIPPGQFLIKLAKYTFLDIWDSNAGYWRPLQVGPDIHMVNSDGANYRLANRTGSVIGGVITNSGTGYTSAPAVTISGSTETFTAILGAAINLTITKTNAGSGYALPPMLVIDPPPAGGIQATATTTLSAGTIGTITVTNQGAGYTTAPAVTVIPAPGDTTGTGAVLTTALIAAGTAGGPDTVCAIIPTSLPAVGFTAVPAFVFSGGGGTGLAATPIMCWTCTSLTLTGPTHAGNGNLVWIPSFVTSGTPTLTNGVISTGIFTPTVGYTNYTLTSTTSLTYTIGGAAAAQIINGGLHQTAAGAIVIANSDGTISAATTAVTVMGGTPDTSYLQPI